MSKSNIIYKHLRGRHDQRDHAWNRGMGAGGFISSDGTITRAQVTQQEYRTIRQGLANDVRDGLITRQMMREKLSGLKLESPSRRLSAMGKIQELRNSNVNLEPIKRDEPNEYMPNPVSLEELAPGGKIHTALLKAYDETRLRYPDFPKPEMPRDVSFQFLVNQTDIRDALSAVYEVLGYNAKPEIRNWDDINQTENVHEVHKNNGPLYRGVESRTQEDIDKNTGFDATTDRTPMTGKEMMDDLRTGEKHYVGFGLMGYGTYSTTALELAIRHGDAIVKLALKPDAVLQMPNETQNISTVEYAVINHFGRFDQGILMALAGYDAYFTSGDRGESYININILNRGKMIVSEETLSKSEDRSEFWTRDQISSSGSLSKREIESLFPKAKFD